MVSIQTLVAKLAHLLGVNITLSSIAAHLIITKNKNYEKYKLYTLKTIKPQTYRLFRYNNILKYLNLKRILLKKLEITTNIIMEGYDIIKFDFLVSGSH